MINTITYNKKTIEKERKIFEKVLFIVLSISFIYIGNIFLKINQEKLYIESTIFFIRGFNSVLSILAVGSAFISYGRLKSDSLFIIALMYLGLSVGILTGQVDFWSFYYDELTLYNYITVSTSLLRVLLIIVAIIPKNKIKTFIMNNKKTSIIFVILYTIIFNIIEKNMGVFELLHSSEFFIVYNIFLAIVYVTCSLWLSYVGIKEKRYIFLIWGCSIFMLGIKAVYAIYIVNTASFNVKLTSVSITYIIFLIVIIGSFWEIYLYINKTKILNENLSLFYNLVDNNKHSFMYITNEYGEISYANKKFKEYNNLSMKEDVKKLNSSFFKGMSTMDNKAEILETLNKKGVWRGILKNIDEYKAIDCSIQLLDNLYEERLYAITYMDISEIIEKELELEKLKVYTKERTEFVSNISHEFRTPINIFYSTLQLLDSFLQKSDNDFKSTYEKYRKTLHINCKRMLRLVNNVIGISKIEMGIGKGNFDYYNLVALVEDVTLSVVNYADMKSINIEFDTNEEEFITKCDPNMIEKVILNLLSNAIKFTPENKNIYVNICVNDDYAEISIKDEGIGISQNDKMSIFERFVQADKSLTRQNEGSGIGLSIVKSIIDIHGGYISVESEIGKGSVFRIIMPNRYYNIDNYKVYDIDNYNTELELSDIYEISI